MDLLKKAYEAAQSESVAEVQAKLREMWEGSLAAFRSNMQSAVQLNTRLTESYGHFLNKSGGNGRAAAPKSYWMPKLTGALILAVGTSLQRAASLVWPPICQDNLGIR